MGDTITKGATVINLARVLGYEFVREYGNSTTPIIGDDDLDVLYEPAGLRQGTLDILALNLTDAMALDALHLATGTYAFASTDLPALNMTYVPVGRCRVGLDSRGRLRWVVSIDFQEVS